MIYYRRINRGVNQIKVEMLICCMGVNFCKNIWLDGLHFDIDNNKAFVF